MAETYAQLRELPEAELIERFDAAAKQSGVALEWYRYELNRRENVRLTQQLVWLTWAVALLGVASIALTVVTLTR